MSRESRNDCRVYRVSMSWRRRYKGGAFLVSPLPHAAQTNRPALARAGRHLCLCALDARGQLLHSYQLAFFLSPLPPRSLPQPAGVTPCRRRTGEFDVRVEGEARSPRALDCSRVRSSPSLAWPSQRPRRPRSDRRCGRSGPVRSSQSGHRDRLSLQRKVYKVRIIPLLFPVLLSTYLYRT
jgi:hypothetical protein